MAHHILKDKGRTYCGRLYTYDFTQQGDTCKTCTKAKHAENERVAQFETKLAKLGVKVIDISAPESMRKSNSAIAVRPSQATRIKFRATNGKYKRRGHRW